jgi:hypothetical protein
MLYRYRLILCWEQGAEIPSNGKVEIPDPYSQPEETTFSPW